MQGRMMELSNLILTFKKFGYPRQMSVDIDSLTFRHFTGHVFHWAINDI